MTTITTLILDITNECLADCAIEGGNQAEAPTLTAQHRTAIIECAKLGHAYAITRRSADEALTNYKLLNLQSKEAWETHIEQDAAANQLQRAFTAAMQKRRELFDQVKAQA